MPRIPIDQLDDPRLAMYRNLKATNFTRSIDQFVLEGEKLLDRLLVSPFAPASVLVTDRREEEIAPRVPPDVPLYVVPQSLVSMLVGFNFHQGVLACGHRRSGPGLSELVRSAGKRLTVVVCPAVHNPINLGTIVRIGDVFGIDAILVGGHCPDPFSRRVIRSSMGSVLSLPVILSPDLERDAERLRSEWGVELMSTVVDPSGAEPLRSALRPDRLALFLGSEGNGLDPAWVARCSRKITIPMRPGAESLNVAVAAGILLHHLTHESSFASGAV
jgi:tRNA G18 (ribose-2'-O)-methylase SpoU